MQYECQNKGKLDNLICLLIGKQLVGEAGQAANLGVDVIMRQDLYGHYYGLINRNLDPNPVCCRLNN